MRFFHSFSQGLSQNSKCARRHSWPIEFAAAVALAFVVGCGGSTSDGGGHGACPAVTGCGGDITGTWHVTSICASGVPTSLDTSGLPDACIATLTNSLASLQQEPQDATIEFDSAGHYQESGSTQGSGTYDYDAACLSALGQGPASSSTCSTIEDNLKNDPQLNSVTCSAVGGSCRCPFGITTAFSDTGTYHSSGNNLVLDDGDPSGPVTGPYCVAGTVAQIGAQSGGVTGALDLSR